MDYGNVKECSLCKGNNIQVVFNSGKYDEKYSRNDKLEKTYKNFRKNDLVC